MGRCATTSAVRQGSRVNDITSSLSADALSDLIRIDTSNFGTDDGPGERVAAEYAAARLTECGLTPQLLESAPRRTNVVTRWPGRDSFRPPLLVHGHLDVVPAQSADWSVDPFAGEVKDGFVWGRGAIDMKQFIAQLLVLVAQRQRDVRPPARDVILVFTADEEASGQRGAYWLAREHRDLFDGVVDAMGEGGGFSLSLPTQRRLYPIGTGEKGLMWTRVVADGRAGHGSMVNRENAVTRLAAAVARVGEYEFPIELTPTVSAMLEILADELGVTKKSALADPEALCDAVPLVAGELRAALRHMANPTMLTAGYKANVIPGAAEAVIDARPLPGLESEFLKVLDELLGPNLRREALVHDEAHEGPVGGDVWNAIASAVAAEDPDSRVMPSLDIGGTDSKAFVPLGIRCYGFTPIRFPSDEPHPELFHGIDERVPIDGLEFGLRVLDRIFDTI
jgi:acetylornithine deacetylase/succinyl-diaminopimelate desuccinylase-like protein